VIKKSRPTLYFGVPTLYAAQLAALDTAKPDLSFRCAIAAPPARHFPPTSSAAGRRRTGLAILDGWGSTELLHIALSNTPAVPAAGQERAPGAGLCGAHRRRRTASR
jgi:acyl-coenzyme A synthetase/AMP-(fatty) acid ligase